MFCTQIYTKFLLFVNVIIIIASRAIFLFDALSLLVCRRRRRHRRPRRPRRLLHIISYGNGILWRNVRHATIINL